MATLEDYALAYHLAARPMARSVHTISPQALALARAVADVHALKVEKAREKGVSEESVSVSVKELAKHLRWAKRTVQKWVDQAEAGELIDVTKDGNRLAIRPLDGAPLEEAAFRLLPEPELLSQAVGEGGSYAHPLTGDFCVLSLPKTACAIPAKTPTNAVQDEENQRARYAHERARTLQEPAPVAQKQRARFLEERARSGSPQPNQTLTYVDIEPESEAEDDDDCIYI